MSKLRFFPSRESWARHMHIVHTTSWLESLHNGYEWSCSICHTPSTSTSSSRADVEDEFVKHVQTDHLDVQPSDARLLATISCFPLPQPKDTCPICAKTRSKIALLGEDDQPTAPTAADTALDSAPRIVRWAEDTVEKPSRHSDLSRVEKCVARHLKALALYFLNGLLDETVLEADGLPSHVVDAGVSHSEQTDSDSEDGVQDVPGLSDELSDINVPDAPASPIAGISGGRDPADLDEYEVDPEPPDIEADVSESHQEMLTRVFGPEKDPESYHALEPFVRKAHSQSLGNKLGRLFERTGQMGDLEEAISTASQAVNSTPVNHPDYAERLDKLGVLLQSRFEHTGQIGDLEGAISTARQAVNSTPVDHPDHVGRLDNLGVFLQIWYDHTGEIIYLREAVSTARQAVDLTPIGHPDYAGRLNDLRNKLESQFKHTREMTDIEESTSIKSWHDCPDSTIDICFIHGLNGDRERTWTAPGQSAPWPETLLPPRLSKARIFTYGYDASVVMTSVASTNRLIDHATSLLANLTTYRTCSNTSSRPLIFVAHSLGGLVCKEAILLSRNNLEPHLRGIFDCTKGIMFMGTPHKGSRMANLADKITSAIGLVTSANKSLLETLETNDQLLEDIQVKFSQLIREQREGGRRLQVTCFYEALPSRGAGMVVPRESATLEGYTSMSIHANHIDMVRFASADDDGFKRLLRELVRWQSQAGKEN